MITTEGLKGLSHGFVGETQIRSWAKTGLGLFSANDMASQLGGKIAVDSEFEVVIIT